MTGLMIPLIEVDVSCFDTTTSVAEVFCRETKDIYIFILFMVVITNYYFNRTDNI